MTRKWMALPVVFTFILAGCGGGGTTTTHHPKPVSPPPQIKQTVIGGGTTHVCDNNNAAMQCYLSKPPLGTAPVTANPSAHGVDFAWGGPSCATLKSQGRSFGASYLSTDSSKNWSHSQFDDYVRNGCKVVFVWETGATEATTGFSNGQSDARAALSQYRSYVPHGRVAIYFAIDCDCSGGQVASYFDGVKSILGLGSAGAYGGITPISYLFDTHRISYAWQTYAWSGSARDHRGQLYQYLNDTSVDYDEAFSSDYGQWPFSSTPPKPPVPKIHCFGKGWQHTHFCLNVRAQALHAGAQYKQEQGFLKVSNANLATLHKHYAGEQTRINQIDARAKIELAKHQWAALAISAHNANLVETKLAPALHREAAIAAKIKTETAKAAAAKKLYEGLLGKYGYQKGH